MKVECPDCAGTGIIDPCPRCKGEGKIEHDCYRRGSFELVADIYGSKKIRYGSMGSYENYGVYRCKICNQLWKIRFQFDQGTGADHVYMRPGEFSRRFSFPEDEAATIAQILNAKTIADLPEGLSSEVRYIRGYAKERAEELGA